MGGDLITPPPLLHQRQVLLTSTHLLITMSSTSPQPTLSTTSATPLPSESPCYSTGKSTSNSPPQVQILLPPSPPSPPSSSPRSKRDKLPLRPLTILRSIQAFIVSTGFRDGLSNFTLFPVDSTGFEALQSELFRPKLLSCEEVDKLRYAITKLTFLDTPNTNHSC